MKDLDVSDEAISAASDILVAGLVAKGLQPGTILLILAKAIGSVVALSSPEENAASLDQPGRAMVLALVDEEMLAALRQWAEGEAAPPSSPPASN